MIVVVTSKVTIMVLVGRGGDPGTPGDGSVERVLIPGIGIPVCEGAGIPGATV